MVRNRSGPTTSTWRPIARSSAAVLAAQMAAEDCLAAECAGMAV